MKHVVDTFEAASLLNGDQAMWFLNHTNNRVVAARRRAETARIHFRKIVADGAQNNSLLYVKQRRYQPLDLSVGGAHEMKCQPLRGFVPNAGQAFQFIN